ncbi:hypothetical protein HRbin14_01256 [bacterium HR14]|nr:hypothetical protein HRbin14_01256 [bacterium HR14]
MEAQNLAGDAFHFRKRVWRAENGCVWVMGRFVACERDGFVAHLLLKPRQQPLAGGEAFGIGSVVEQRQRKLHSRVQRFENLQFDGSEIREAYQQYFQRSRGGQLAERRDSLPPLLGGVNKFQLVKLFTPCPPQSRQLFGFAEPLLAQVGFGIIKACGSEPSAFLQQVGGQRIHPPTHELMHQLLMESGHVAHLAEVALAFQHSLAGACHREHQPLRKGSQTGREQAMLREKSVPVYGIASEVDWRLGCYQQTRIAEVAQRAVHERMLGTAQIDFHDCSQSFSTTCSGASVRIELPLW